MQKQALGTEIAVAFGTNQGNIVKAVLIDSDSTQSAFFTGERIHVEVEVEFDNSVNRPSPAVFLHDSKMLNIAGQYFRLTKTEQKSGLNRKTMHFHFMPI